MIILTSDHASYDDQDFYLAFPKKQRKFSLLDSIPFSIYHKGIEVTEIDVNGRNSLDLVPTILDYIDISDENYFLGDSLFSKSENRSKYDYNYFAPTCYYTSKDSKISGILGEDQENFKNELISYFAISK